MARQERVQRERSNDCQVPSPMDAHRFLDQLQRLPSLSSVSRDDKYEQQAASDISEGWAVLCDPPPPPNIPLESSVLHFFDGPTLLARLDLSVEIMGPKLTADVQQVLQAAPSQRHERIGLGPDTRPQQGFDHKGLAFETLHDRNGGLISGHCSTFHATTLALYGDCNAKPIPSAMGSVLPPFRWIRKDK